jgi:hypothetical protein
MVKGGDRGGLPSRVSHTPGYLDLSEPPEVQGGYLDVRPGPGTSNGGGYLDVRPEPVPSYGVSVAARRKAYLAGTAASPYAVGDQRSEDPGLALYADVTPSDGRFAAPAYAVATSLHAERGTLPLYDDAFSGARRRAEVEYSQVVPAGSDMSELQEAEAWL